MGRIKTGDYLAAAYNQMRTLGDRADSSSCVFVVKGQETSRFLVKSFPWPVLTTGEAMDVPTPVGMSKQPGKPKFAFEGQVSISETEKGHAQAIFKALLEGGGKFNATIYRGSLESHSGGLEIVDCFLVGEAGEIDWENENQMLSFQAQLCYHYFGETVPGNS